jgi:hypothetical protein
MLTDYSKSVAGGGMGTAYSTANFKKLDQRGLSAQPSKNQSPTA